MGVSLAFAKTPYPAGDIEDVLDLDIDTSLGMDGAKELAAQLVSSIQWAGDLGTAVIDGETAEVEVLDIGLFFVRFPRSSINSPGVQSTLARAHRLGLTALDEESAEMLKAGLA